MRVIGGWVPSHMMTIIYLKLKIENVYQEWYHFQVENVDQIFEIKNMHTDFFEYSNNFILASCFSSSSHA